MAMHIFKIRCEAGHLFAVRKPKDSLLIPKILQQALCPKCYPNQSDLVCSGCRLPFAVAKHHAKTLCEACFWKEWRNLKLRKEKNAPL